MDGRGDDATHSAKIEPNESLDSFGGHRHLEDPLTQWKDDRGEADLRLTAALARNDATEIIEALGNARVLVALAKSTVEDDPLDKTSSMSVVCLTAADGRIGLLAFTSVESMTIWNSQARPVPIVGRDAAIAALDEFASAMIIDLVGPSSFTLTLPDLVTLSGIDQRWRAVPLIESLLGRVGTHNPIIEIPDSGPIVIMGEPGDLELWSGVLSERGDIHAFVPEGIALKEVSNHRAGE